MQRDDNFDFAILQPEEEKKEVKSPEEKSVEIPDEEIEKLPDINQPKTRVQQKTEEKPAAVVLPKKKAPVAVVTPTSRSVAPSAIARPAPLAPSATARPAPLAPSATARPAPLAPSATARPAPLRTNATARSVQLSPNVAQPKTPCRCENCSSSRPAPLRTNATATSVQVSPNVAQPKTPCRCENCSSSRPAPLRTNATATSVQVSPNVAQPKKACRRGNFSTPSKAQIRAIPSSLTPSRAVPKDTHSSPRVIERIAPLTPNWDSAKDSTPRTAQVSGTPPRVGPLQETYNPFARPLAPLREIPVTSSSPVASLSNTPAPAQMVSPTVRVKSGPSKENSNGHRKRQHIAIYDSAEENDSKKPKLDDSISDTEYESSEPEFNDSEPDLKNKDSDTDLDSNSEEENDVRGNDIMPFRQAEDINFDVRSMSELPDGLSMAKMGQKKYAEFVRERALTSECVEALYTDLKEAAKEQEQEMPDPRGLTVKLMPHQKQGLKWMKWREDKKPKGGILADDMGLGKTLQIIALVLAEKNERQASNEEDDDDDFDEEDWGFSKSDTIHDGKTLVICPASLIRQWEKEVLTKCKRNELRVHVYHGPTRQISEAKLAKYDIVITTYNLVKNEYELDVVPKENKDARLFKIHWQRIVLDEAHYIRNHKTAMSKAVCELRSTIRWALTGTPIQNQEADFYALLKFLKCSPYDEWSVWRKWVSNRSSTGNQRLILITKSLMLRRTKSELAKQNLIEKLPPKEVTILSVNLDKEERLAYQKLLLYSQTFFYEFLRQRKDKEHLKTFGCHMRQNNLIAQEVPAKMSRALKMLMRNHDDIGQHYILVLILRLRQICCHPALIKAMLDQQELQVEGVDFSKQNMSPDLLAELNQMLSDDEDDDEDGFEIDASMAKKVMSYANPVFSNTRKSSKMKQILEVVDTVLDKGEKLIIVSQWTSFLSIIAKNLQYVEGAKYATFAGNVNVKERQVILDRINDPNDKLNILLLSLTAGGVGLNLVGANNLMLVDLHWNPQLERQAQDRIYRFGQVNNVHIYRFICADTIEEKIKKLQDRKLQIAKSVLTGTVSNTLTIEDLKLLFS